MAMGNMIRRVVVQSVTVVRDGQRVTPERGKAFDFTAEEIEYLDRISPAASRKAVDESATAPVAAPAVKDDADEDDAEDEAPAKATAPAKAKPAGKKAAAAAKPASSEDDDI